LITIESRIRGVPCRATRRWSRRRHDPTRASARTNSSAAACDRRRGRTHLDITSRKTHEDQLRRGADELREATAQLKKTNEELDQFAYITSHDLRRIEFAVADNGPGIEPRYHEEKIFVIFQTLAARDKVEGTGVGLALVKNIVEGEGGAVRVASRAGEGATFTFTWPRRRATPATAPIKGT
jgi:light-regulated signal transduction histidine kinase (bacteriophytochrome)